MGCCYSRDRCFSLENDYILPFEFSLGFHKTKALLLVSHLKKSTVSNSVSPQAFQDFTNILLINSQNHSSFFQHFSAPLGFDSTKLTLLSILLSKDSQSDKVNFIFELYDPNNQNFITNTKIESLIIEIFSISCDIIPNYVSQMHIDNEDLNKYVENLRSVNKLTAIELAVEFMSAWECMNKEVFVNRMILKYPFLLKTKDCRKFCWEVYELAIEPYRSTSEVEEEEENKRDLNERGSVKRENNHRRSNTSFL